MLSDNLFVPEHPNLLPPSDLSAKIWRYMSFAKYCALLRARQLYFTAVALFDDSWEGSHGMWYGAGIELLSLAKNVNWSALSLKDFHSEWNRWVRVWTYVNCWHINDGDSEAMWKLYASAEGSVAVESTVSRLREVLPPDIGLGRVIYVDFYASPPTPHELTGYPAPFVFKRKSFEHERELRAIIQRVPLTKDGVVDLWNTGGPAGHPIDVDLNKLIERVHVQPNAPSWLVDTAQEMTVRFGFEFPVAQSHDRALF